MRRALAALLLASPALAQCSPAAPEPSPTERPPAAQPRFPAPDRPVAAIVSDQWSDEASREDAGEAARVIALAGIRPGMRVADIGAGAGYYAAPLARAVGPGGRVFAQDIVPNYVARLRERVGRAGLANVEVVQGLPDDPRLPASIDVALMVHMYHEIESPFALLWRLRGSLSPNGRVVIVDADRPTGSHGTPPALLRCELAAVGFAPAGFQRLRDGYAAAFVPQGARPEPGSIRPCAAPR